MLDQEGSCSSGTRLPSGLPLVSGHVCVPCCRPGETEGVSTLTVQGQLAKQSLVMEAIYLTLQGGATGCISKVCYTRHASRAVLCDVAHAHYQTAPLEAHVLSLFRFSTSDSGYLTAGVYVPWVSTSPTKVLALEEAKDHLWMVCSIFSIIKGSEKACVKNPIGF